MRIEDEGRKPLMAVGRGQDRALWAIVLAGGDGTRLRDLTRRLHGDDRPKQFARIIGGRSLLRATLDRTARRIPAARTVVVVRSDHADFLAAEFADSVAPWIIVQPANRGTAVAVLLAAHWIRGRDPAAALAVFPSDHYVTDDAAFMARVAGAHEFLERRPGWTLLLGAPPTDADPDYGWLEPGARLGDADGQPVSHVRAFLEKPSPGQAHRGFMQGWLWNTFVMITHASTLIEMEHALLPEVHRQLTWVGRFTGTDDEAWAVDHAYSVLPAVDFSRDVLARCPPVLGVVPLPPDIWSDWGTPARVARSCRSAGLTPTWLTA